MTAHSLHGTGPLANLWLQSGSRSFLRAVPISEWDAVTLDLQHGQMGLDRCIDLLDVLYGRGSLVLVRVSALDSAEIGKVLDAGADGVICPGIDSADAALHLVQCCSYPPQGRRSFGPTRHRLGGQRDWDYKKKAPIVLAMIESAAALAQVKAIASVPRLTGVYVGPSDLSVDLGLEPGFDRTEPKVREALRAIIVASRAVNLLTGVHCSSSAYAGEMASWGANFLTLSSDYALMARASTAALADFRRAASGSNVSVD
jgi:4-hydroxy-2-oxoheptanedioate aldolase